MMVRRMRMLLGLVGTLARLICRNALDTVSPKMFPATQLYTPGKIQRCNAKTEIRKNSKKITAVLRTNSSDRECVGVA